MTVDENAMKMEKFKLYIKKSTVSDIKCSYDIVLSFMLNKIIVLLQFFDER